MGSIPLPALAVQTPENPLDSYAKALSVKSMLGQQKTQELQQTALAQENQQRENALKDSAAISKALRDSGGDFAKFRENVKKPEYGVSAPGQLSLDSQLMAHQKAAYELDTTTLENATKKSAAAAAALQPLASLDAASFQAELPKIVNQAIVNGAITPDQAKEFLNVKNQDDFNTHLSMLKTVAQQTGEIAEKQSKGIAAWKEDPGTGTMVNVDKTSPDFGKHMPISNPIPIPQDLAQALGVPDMAGKPTTPKFLKEMKDARDAGNHFENYDGSLNLVDGQGKLIKRMGASTSVATFNMQAGGLTDAAKDQSAQKYLATGQLPTGMRSPGMAKEIINRAAELGAGQNLAANSAEYKANADSLKSIQKSFDGINAFEETAGKNLDVFLQKAQKAVDSGLPILNTPARYVAGKLGGTDQTAFETARQTAVTEIAKVLSNPGASGVLSDSARHEVESLIKPDATLAQIMSAANVLKTDMANRKDAYQTQIADIKKRLGGGGNSPTKTLSMAQIQQAAKDHNVSVEEATKQAKAVGYTVQ